MSEKNGAEKKEQKAEAPKKGKAEESGYGGCLTRACKKSVTRFGFCEEHYEHFKFGLIKKTGEQVSDYEKKYGHFVAWKTKQGAHKVA